LKTKLESETQPKWYKVLSRIIKTHSPFKKSIGVATTLIFLNKVFFMTIPFLVGLIVTKLSNSPNSKEIIYLLVGILILYLLAILADKARFLWEVKFLDMNVSNHLSSNTNDHLKTLSIGQHRNKHSLVTISKVSSGESSMKNFFSSIFYDVLPMMTGVSIALCAMIVVYPVVGLICLFFSILIIILGIKIGKSFAGPVDKFQSFSKNVVSKSGGEYIRNMDSLKIAVEEDRYKEIHKGHREYKYRLFKKIFTQMGISFASIQLVSTLGRISALCVAVYMVFTQRYEIGSIAAIIAWTDQSLGILYRIGFIYRNMISGWADIIQYFRVMDTESDIKTVNNPVEMSTLNGEVVFDSVFFSYPGSEENSLNGISFKIEPGQKVGIVGPTGSGKTTLLSMLQIAYLPDIGSIRVDGIDLSNVNQSEYRSNIGFIEQHPLILSQSLKKNMLFGLSKEQRINVSDKDLENVLDRLKLSDLKHRLNKNVGELGIKLSGGQKQRIIIARVLLKKPEMLIVDEGTSAVDPVTEKIIHDELDNLSPGSTRIFVAHRISTVQNSDKIIVMQDGSIEAIGTHDELLESCVLYQELVQNLLLRT